MFNWVPRSWAIRMIIDYYLEKKFKESTRDTFLTMLESERRDEYEKELKNEYSEKTDKEIEKEINSKNDFFDILGITKYKWVRVHSKR